MPSGSNVCEYRIVMPLTVEEYQVAQLWSVAEASKNETGGGEGIEVLHNEPFDENNFPPDSPLLPVTPDGPPITKGQYTHKIYHLESRVPSFIRLIAPKGSLKIHEKAWNAYPYCRTIITNPDYMKDGFFIKIETMHVPDRGEQENVHQLSKQDLENRKVDRINIANDPIKSADYKEEWDPKLVRSEKTGRGPLQGEWTKTCEPVMCCYKLVSVKFKWFGLQNRVEKFIQNQERRIFMNFHRQVFCWLDKYHGLTMEDIRRIEAETKKELDDARAKGEIRGTVAADEKE